MIAMPNIYHYGILDLYCVLTHNISDIFDGENHLRPYTEKGQCPPASIMPDNLCQERIQKPGQLCGPCSHRRYNGNITHDTDLYVCAKTCGGSKCQLLGMVNNINIHQEAMVGTAAYVRGRYDTFHQIFMDHLFLYFKVFLFD